MPHDDIDRLEQIQAAYGIQQVADLGGLATAIIARRRGKLLAGDHRAVMAVINHIVGLKSTYEALVCGADLPTDTHAAMVRAAEKEKQATPGMNVVEEVLADMRVVLAEL